MKVKLTQRMLDYLDTTGVGQKVITLNHPNQLSSDHLNDVGDEWDVAMLILKTKAVIPRSDGSMWPDLTKAEIKELREYAGYFVTVSNDPAKTAFEGEMGGLADLNAARAQVRRCDDALEKIRRKEVREYNRSM